MEYSVDKIEAVVDAISRVLQSDNPDRHLYSIRNPLGLESFAKLGKHPVTDEGLRVFNSHLAGYKAAVFDVHLKASGKSRARLKPENKLRDLLGCYKIKEPDSIGSIVNFLKRALKDSTITADTNLSYFTTGN